MVILPKGGKMPVFRVNKTHDYTIMSNCHLKDKRLSLKSKGLLSMMLSLPDDWDYTINGLVAISKENETAMKSAMRELKVFGYLEVSKERTPRGTFEYIYNIFERPNIAQPEVEKPEVEKLGVENPSVENQGQLNTKELNTKESNTKEIKKKYKRKSETAKKPVTRDCYISTDRDVDRTFKEYVEMRQAIGKQFKTASAIDKAIEKLHKLSGGSKEKAIMILNESIMNEWQGLFPLKDEDKKNPPAKKIDNFRNFEERTYDYDELEKKFVKN